VPPRLPPPPAARRLPLALLALVLLHHFGVWLDLSLRKGIPFGALLDRWDSAHYSAVVLAGPEGSRWAFLPLYPALVRGLRALGPEGLAPPLAGALVSTLALLLFVLAVSRLQAQRPTGLEGPHALLAPASPWGWFLLLYGPASYTLHSHHTEGLFLLLSFGALWAAAEGRAWTAGLLAALCVWTRNQGVAVAVAAAFLAAQSAPAAQVRARAGRFLAAAGVSFAGFLALLAFQALHTGDPLASVHAQAGWTHARSAGEVLRTLWLGNPWQSANRDGLLRHGFYLLALGAALALWRRSRPLGLYALLSLAMVLAQGELVNAFRFAGVLFPLAFLAGDWLARLPPWVRAAVAVAVVVLNHSVARSYALGRWAY
jgi:hypothetical protein